MQQTQPGDLVTVAGDGPTLDGIVFDLPSRTKVVVAVIDRDRGPVFRTVHLDVLTERGAGADDRALRMLIRRTPGTSRGAARKGAGAGGDRAGHVRGAAHRTTGR